jgi:nucleotide-binding universal stress UspA family protein
MATDFDEDANRALDVAIALATKFESKLTLMHAYSLPVSGYGYAEGLLWPIDDLSLAAKTALNGALRKAKERYPKTDGVLVCGDPSSQILDLAAASGADLIVVGTHGRRGFSRVVLGSVAEKVVRLSPVPVLTVSGKEHGNAKKKSVAQDATTKG